MKLSCSLSVTFMFLHDWNHAWKIHGIFSNASNNLPEKSPFWPEVYFMYFLKFWCIFFLLVHVVSKIILTMAPNGKAAKAY